MQEVQWIAELILSLSRPTLAMFLKLPVLASQALFQNLKGIKWICFLFAVVSKVTGRDNLKCYLEVLLVLEMICSFRDETVIVNLSESLWRTVLSRVWLRKKSTNSQNSTLRVKKHPYFLSQTMLMWHLNSTGLLQTGLWHVQMPTRFSSSLLERIEQENTVQKKNLRNAISGPKSLYFSKWRSREQVGSKGNLNSMVDHGLSTPPAPSLQNFWRHLGLIILWGQVECM